MSQRASGTSLLPKPQIITTKEARKLLGTKARDMTNEEVSSLINDYEQLARLAIQQYLVRK